MKESLKKKLFTLFGIISISLIVVVPRILKDRGYIAEPLQTNIQLIQEKLGNNNFDQFIKAILPSGYSAICIKRYGDRPDLLESVKTFNERNSKKMNILIKSIKYLLSDSEKESLDKYSYILVSGNINSGEISCDTLSDRISSGEWDL